MTKYSKYLNTFFFAIAVLATYNFMTSYEPAGRYQYRNFEFEVVYRTIADWLLLTSLFYLLIQEWNSVSNKRLSTIASIIYITIIMVDMYVWLWLTHANPIYYYITLVHTFPILVIISKLKIDIKPKQLFFIGLAILLAGFLFDMVFINIPYPDMTDDIFDRNLLLEKTRNLIYYVGFVTIVFAVITFTKRIKSAKTAI
jgi:membrane-associated HD superfamily phosphohydrolase